MRNLRLVDEGRPPHPEMAPLKGSESDGEKHEGTVEVDFVFLV